VIEHLPNPDIVFTVAQKALKKGGLLIIFCPNGSKEHQMAFPYNYHKGWGLVHPLYITQEYCSYKLKDYPYFICSNPFSLKEIKDWDKNSQKIGNLKGNELLIMAFIN